MPTFWDPDSRRDICRRVGRLTPDAAPRWGRFTAAQMMAHVNDAFRMATGELVIAPRYTPLRYFPLKHLVLDVLPFPKGAPTAPELLARCAGADFERERQAFLQMAERAAARPASDRWADHPLFGRMSHAAWGRLAYKHTDHHLRQFGV